MSADQAAGSDRAELAALTAQVLDRECPTSRVRGLLDGPGTDEGLWRTAVDLGWPGMALPASVGGGDGTWADAAVVLEELGAHVAVSPLPTHLLTAGLLAAHPGGGPDLLDVLARGDRRATVALIGPAGRYRTDALGVAYVDTGSGRRLSGRAAFVPDLMTADLVVVAAAGSGGPRLVVVRTDAGGVTRAATETVDPTRRLGVLELHEVAVGPGDELTGDGEAAYQDAVDLGALIVTSDALGAGARALVLATEHAKARYQFGRPIGSFQAVKHLLADMLVAVEASRAAVAEAARALGEPADGRERRQAVAVAASYARDACAGVAAGAMQVLGGLGFTWEHDCHLLLKRTKLDQQLFGSPRWHRSRLADSAFGPARAPSA